MKMTTKRVYPACCTSAFCGSSNCHGCQNESTLAEFKAWVQRTNAKPSDPVWCPNVYVAEVEV